MHERWIPGHSFVGVRSGNEAMIHDTAMDGHKPCIYSEQRFNREAGNLSLYAYSKCFLMTLFVGRADACGWT